ncbi:MAG: hypothetical protein NTX52_10765 [Planctomycetota bacterium]|nr:hypothetical protein [Planctomycetota bacterium]
MSKLIFTLICLSAFGGAIPCQAKIIYVDADANGLNDGSSWQNAYNYLQNALDNANSSLKPIEIRVAQGIYRPDRSSAEPNGSSDRTATFQLINGVTLKGGYAGFGEPDPNARNIEKYQTILTGDLDGNDIEVSDPCDLLTEPTRDENSYHVVTGSGTDATAVLDGFTITCGNPNGPPYDRDGGGMYNVSGSPTISNCIFTANSASCGGGMFNEFFSSPTVTNCTFIGNSAIDLCVAYYPGGGGMANWTSSSPTLTNCFFTHNIAWFGGGVVNINSASVLYGCSFSGNTGLWNGGGMYNNHCKNMTLKNSIFTSNIAKITGGGISSESSDIVIVNCTFSRNSAGNEGGGMCNSLSSHILTNCILWNNIPDEIYPDNATQNVTYSDICGGWPGESNLNKDPCFADPNDGDFHLKSQAGRWDANEGRWTKDGVTSLCIDAGDPASPIGYEPFPNGGIINMGAYGGTEEASKSYFGKPPCETIMAGDINGDCVVNFKDFALMAFHWLEEH